MTNQDEKSNKKFLPQNKYEWFLLLGTIGLTEVIFSWIGVGVTALFYFIAPNMTQAGKFDSIIGLFHLSFGIVMMVVFYLLAFNERNKKGS